VVGVGPALAAVAPVPHPHRAHLRVGHRGRGHRLRGGHLLTVVSLLVVNGPSWAWLLVTDESGPSAWELDCHASLTATPQVRRRLRLSVSTRQVPLLTFRSGTQRARSPGDLLVVTKLVTMRTASVLHV